MIEIDKYIADEFKTALIDDLGIDRYMERKRLIDKYFNQVLDEYKDYEIKVVFTKYDFRVQIYLQNSEDRFSNASGFFSYDRMIRYDKEKQLQLEMNALKSGFDLWLDKMQAVILIRQLEKDLIDRYAEKYKVCFDRIDSGNFRTVSLMEDSANSPLLGEWFYERKDRIICTVGFRNAVSFHYCDDEHIKREFELITQAFDFAIKAY